MSKTKAAIFCLLGFLMSAPAVWADFTLTDPVVTGTGSGVAVGTARIVDTGPWSDVPEAGFFNDQTVTPTGGAIAFQESYAEASNGTAAAGTSGAISDTQANGGDIVVATTDGATDAAARQEYNLVGTNTAMARLIAAGGAGSVADEVSTQTGFMLALADAKTYSDGSNYESTTDEPLDAEASSSGSAGVSYRFAGSAGLETVSVSNADIEATADVDQEKTEDTYAESRGSALALMGWTDSETLGQVFSAQVGLNSEARTDHVSEDGWESNATANAAGDIDLNFTYRPNPIFSFLGNANGSTDASVTAYDDYGGQVEAQGAKHAIGVAGTSTDFPSKALAWIVGSVSITATESDFDGTGIGHAVNPAVLGETDFDPDPSMAVGTQYGTYAAAMGSSSLVNAEVTAQVTTVDEDVTDPDFDWDYGDTIMATAFGFAIAAQDMTSGATIGSEPITLYDLASESAFVGFGSITGADEGEGDDAPLVTAETHNLFGAASSPSYMGVVNNGNSSSSIYEDENGVYQRENAASADLAMGTNYLSAVAHNEGIAEFNVRLSQLDVNSPSRGMMVDAGGEFDFTDATWWQIFGGGTIPHVMSTSLMAPQDITTIPVNDGTEGPFDHISGAFIGAGGN